ncbi:MAG: hypothetical protein AAGF11_48865 [Myxococcota bacterium]
MTKSIFKSSLYIISRQHQENDSLSEGIDHLHHTVQIAKALISGYVSILGVPADFWRKNITHVVMHIGPTKQKKGNRYAGYEHFHSFIVLEPDARTEAMFQNERGPHWAKDMGVDTGLWGDVSTTSYAPDRYELAVQRLYEQEHKPLKAETTPVYFSIEFRDGAPSTTSFSI